ncbi:hypothetical protein PMIN01_13606 [Paraphaeosphaeria minitans]|uniref:Uncharacterized protein n=1 Tax=Paraphaeosphaeria minitans TaxID=565426 RepID=A0A9P6G4R3_9PLEO|nr:hypothetical protein PMIN01_13606 [Paraphaeosphaeria minitans]
MSKNTVSSDIILEGQSNWELWFFVVKRIAEAGDAWEYIDPNQLHHPLQKPEKPIRPAPTDLLYHIKDKPTVHDQIKMLQNLYSSTTADQEYRVQKAYESAKVLHARRSNIEDWCNDFLVAYNRAKQLNLPETLPMLPQSRSISSKPRKRGTTIVTFPSQNQFSYLLSWLISYATIVQCTQGRQTFMEVYLELR